jgi:hypothetical protein
MGRLRGVPAPSGEGELSEFLFAASLVLWNGVLEGEGKNVGVWYSDLKYGV